MLLFLLILFARCVCIFKYPILNVCVCVCLLCKTFQVSMELWQNKLRHNFRSDTGLNQKDNDEINKNISLSV